MKDGLWHVVLFDGLFEAVWVHEDADLPATLDTYLAGNYRHRFEAEGIAAAANTLIDGDSGGCRLDALRRIVWALR